MQEIEESIKGWRAYKYYLIGEWQKTREKYYKRAIRKVDKQIKKLLKGIKDENSSSN